MTPYTLHTTKNNEIQNTVLVFVLNLYNLFIFVTIKLLHDSDQQRRARQTSLRMLKQYGISCIYHIYL